RLLVSPEVGQVHLCRVGGVPGRRGGQLRGHGGGCRRGGRRRQGGPQRVRNNRRYSGDPRRKADLDGERGARRFAAAVVADDSTDVDPCALVGTSESWSGRTCATRS